MSKTINRYTLGEEIINSISHGIGAGLGIAGLVLLIIQAHSILGIITSIIYSIILINMYVISCIYHALSPKVKGKAVLRNLDHSNVLLMVAGTYTPICLCLMKGALGWIVFSLVWTVTIIAIVLNSINVDKYQKICLAGNLIVGWSSLVIIKQLIASTTTEGIILLIGGGIIYTIGALLYAIGKKHRYFHSVFHFFILAGSILHYFFIYFFVI